jgi:hypothetical protein
VSITGYDPLTLDVNFTEKPDEARTVTFGADYCTFVDPCENLTKMASGTDSASLTTGSADPENFNWPDGTHDDDRIRRDRTTADVPIVYDPPGPVSDLRVQFHWFALEDGSLDVYESTDGGSTWTQVSQSVTQYDTGEANGWKNELHEYSSFSDGTDQVKLVLTGGSKHWSGQVGHVEIDYEM